MGLEQRADSGSMAHGGCAYLTGTIPYQDTTDTICAQIGSSFGKLSRLSFNATGIRSTDPRIGAESRATACSSLPRAVRFRKSLVCSRCSTILGETMTGGTTPMVLA